MATADLGEDSRDVGVGDTPQEATRAALKALGQAYASEMAESTNRTKTWPESMRPVQRRQEALAARRDYSMIPPGLRRAVLQ